MYVKVSSSPTNSVLPIYIPFILAKAFSKTAAQIEVLSLLYLANLGALKLFPFESLVLIISK